MAESNGLSVVVGFLLCLVIVVDAADPVLNPSLANSGTASLDSDIPFDGKSCQDNDDPETSYVATVAIEKYTDDMCFKIFEVQCDSDAFKDPSTVDPCINEGNDSAVNVKIIGFCDDNFQKNCNSFLQLSSKAYNAIADLAKSPLLQVNYGPTSGTVPDGSMSMHTKV